MLVNTTLPYFQGTPSLAVSPAGAYAIAFASDVNDGTGLNIRARLYGDAGMPVGPDLLVNTALVGNQMTPVAAMNAQGDLIIAWTGPDAAGVLTVFARTFDASGTPRQAEEFRISPPNAAESIVESVAADSAGRFIITWSGLVAGRGQDTFAARYDAAGGLVIDPFAVNTTGTSHQAMSDVAASGDGTSVVAWASLGQDSSGWGIYARRYGADGVAQSLEIPVNLTKAGDQESPSVAMDAAGGFVVAWQSEGQDGSGMGIYARRFDAGGAPLTGEIPVTNTLLDDQTQPDIAMTPEGTFVVTWQSHGQDGGGAGIFARSFLAGGQPEGDEFRVNTTVEHDQTKPSIGMADSGNHVIAWESFAVDGTRENTYARRYVAGIPQVMSIDVVSDPGGGPIDEIRIAFSEAVSGLDLADLRLTRDGGPNLLGDGQAVWTMHSITWTLSGLAAIAFIQGQYTLELNAAESGIVDAHNNPLAAGASITFAVSRTVPPASDDVDHYVAMPATDGSIQVFHNRPVDQGPSYVLSAGQAAGMRFDGRGGNDSLTILGDLGFSPEFIGGAGSDRLAIHAGQYDLQGIHIDVAEELVVGGGSLIIHSSRQFDAIAITGAGAVHLAAGQYVILNTTALSITDSGALNVNDNELIVSSPGMVAAPQSQDQIRQLLLSGRAGGDWDGPGIQSLAIAGDSARTLGLSLEDDQARVKYTWAGDANLDRRVDFDDFKALSIGYVNYTLWRGDPAAHPDYRATFAAGDLDYDGAVGIGDFKALSIGYVAYRLSQAQPAPASAASAAHAPRPIRPLASRTHRSPRHAWSAPDRALERRRNTSA